jgi:hypothetical protein
MSPRWGCAVESWCSLLGADGPSFVISPRWGWALESSCSPLGADAPSFMISPRWGLQRGESGRIYKTKWGQVHRRRREGNTLDSPEFVGRVQPTGCKARPERGLHLPYEVAVTIEQHRAVLPALEPTPKLPGSDRVLRGQHALGSIQSRLSLSETACLRRAKADIKTLREPTAAALGCNLLLSHAPARADLWTVRSSVTRSLG